MWLSFCLFNRHYQEVNSSPSLWVKEATGPRWAWESRWALFCRLQKSCVCPLTLKTTPLSVLNTFLCCIPQSVLLGLRSNPPSSIEGLTWWVSPLQGKDFLQLCKNLHQWQSYVMPLFDLMTSNSPKMDLWTHLGYNVSFNFDYVLLGLMTILPYICNCKMWFVSVWKLLSYKWLSRLLWVPQPPPTITWGPWIRDPQYEG